MRDEHKTREQLIDELNLMRNQAAELKQKLTAGKTVEKESLFAEAAFDSEEKYRILVEGSPIGIYYNDFSGKFLYGNRSAEEIIGYKKEELVGKSFLKLKLLNPHDI
ncbi:MAG: PAS domain S-box protein, partial [bacterium]